LGVPVVASNVGTRPEDVRLFEPGDVDEFIKQVEEALAQLNRSSPRAERRPVPEEEGLTLNRH
jgi:cell division septum initiation protein DivIVA